MRLVFDKNLFKLSFLFIVLLLLNFTAFSQCVTSEGGAIINEFSNGQIKSQEFVEILVIGNGNGENVNLQGYILDDNNEPKKGVGNEPGHVILGPCFSDLSPGQLIVIYNDKQPYPGIELLDNDPSLILIPFNDPCIIKMEGCPNHTTASYDCGYQVYDLDANWNAYIPAHNFGDKIQLLNKEKETIHAFEWGLPTPSKIHSKQRMSYIHSTDYTYNWEIETNSTPGKPNNYQNFLFIQNIQNGAPYENLNGSLDIECTSVFIDVVGGFANYNYLLQIVDIYGTSSNVYYGTSASGEISFTNLDCGKYTLIVNDKLGCKIELEFSISGQGECFVEEPPNQQNYGIGNQCPTCLNGNNCFEWESSSGNTFGLAIPTGKNIVLPYNKGIELQNLNGYLIRKEYDLQKATILSETKYWFNQGDLKGVCSDNSTESCSGIDSDGDGICDSDDSCPDSQDNEDSDGDGICNIFDCAPDNAEESTDSDGDGVCDGLDCAPNDVDFYTDTDGDGVCDNEDCQPLNSYIYIGAPCDDNNDCTKNDSFNENCDCIGIFISNCTEGQDCIEGSKCDDGDPCTRADKFDSDCNCIGIKILDCEECEKKSACDDNNDCTYDDIFDANCICKGIELEECSEDCEIGSSCDDSNTCTINDVYGPNCECLGSPTSELTITKEIHEECFSEITLIASGGNINYRWYKDGKTLNEYSDRILVNETGVYSVKNYGTELCEFSTSISLVNNLFDSNILISQSEKSICNQNDPIKLTIDPLLIETKWFYDDVLMTQHNEKSEILIYKEGNYSVFAKNSVGCVNKGEVIIFSTSESGSTNEITITPKHPNYCSGQDVTLSINQQPSTSQILWSTGEISSSINVNSEKIYSVTVTNSQGCISTDKVEYFAEELLDLEKILKSNDFVREKVKIHTVIPAFTKGESSNDRFGPEINAKNSNIYEILRIEADSDPEPIDLIKFAQKRVDSYYHYDQEASGILVDNFCPENSDGYTLSKFIEYSKTNGAFAYYIQKAEDGDETYLYYRQADFMTGIGEVKHKNLFKEVFYSILCNRKNNKNTTLDKPSLYKVKNISSNGIVAITSTDYESIDYIISGNISLPAYDKATFFADGGIGTWNPFSSQRGILISNYRHNGVLLTSDESNITNPVHTNSAIITAKREKINHRLRGGFWEIKIKYDPNSISPLEGELGVESQPPNEEYLVISIPNDNYYAGMGDLWNNIDVFIESSLAEYRTYPSPHLLPACLYDENEFCSLINGKFKWTLDFDGPLSVLNSVLADPINDLKDGFSENIISCFEENKLVDDYYNKGEEHFGEDKVNLLGNLNYHFLKAYPNFNTESNEDNDFVKLVQLSVSDKDDEDNDLEDDALFYKVKSMNDDHFDYHSEWQRFTKLSNLYDFEWGGEGEFQVLTSYGYENKQLNYFDSNLSTENREGYSIQLSKEYNFLTKDQIPIYFDDQFELVQVPGIYIAYAIERKKYDNAISVRDNLIDIAAITFSFGELAPIVWAARLAKIRAALAIGEIATSTINLFLRNSEWCKDVEPKFCKEWQKFIQTAQIGLMVGQGSTFLYSKLRPVKNYYNGLAPNSYGRQAIDEAVETTASKNALDDFHKLMDPNLDDLTNLKTVFNNVDNNYPKLIEQLFESLQPNHFRLFELAEEIKKLPVSGRKEFFSDLIKTANDPGKMGKELANLTAEQVKAWKVLFDPDILSVIRTNTDNLKFVDNILKNYPNVTPENLTHYINRSGGFDIWKSYNSIVLRVGNDIFNAVETPLVNIRKLHGAPKKSRPPNFIDNLANVLQSKGYDLSISPPIEGVKMSDSQVLIFDGHHRIAALEQLGETNMPLRIKDFTEIPDEGMRLMLKIGEESGFYLPSQYPIGYSIPDLGPSLNFDIDLQAIKFLEDNF